MPDATAGSAMRPKVPGVTLRTPVMEVARRMLEEGVRAMVVASSGSDLIAGGITDLDVLRAVMDGRPEAMASDYMSLETVATVLAGSSLDAAVRRMAEESLPLVVVQDGEPPRPVGILTPGDLADYLARG